MSVVVNYMVDEYDVQPDIVVDLRAIDKPNGDDVSTHRHVVVIMEDGSEMWLDIGGVNDDLTDHNFVDIRWMNPVGKMKGIGYFTIVNGMRGRQAEALPDTEGRVVKGKGWNGGYVATLLVDRNGVEQSAILPSNGNG